MGDNLRINGINNTGRLLPLKPMAKDTVTLFWGKGDFGLAIFRTFVSEISEASICFRKSVGVAWTQSVRHSRVQSVKPLCSLLLLDSL